MHAPTFLTHLGYRGITVYDADRKRFRGCVLYVPGDVVFEGETAAEAEAAFRAAVEARVALAMRRRRPIPRAGAAAAG